MRRKGVCYDVGRVMLGHNWRPDFDPPVVRRELEIIRNDLHCNAVRLQGLDIGRLTTAAEFALGLGLEVWFSPEMWDRQQDELLEYLAHGAGAAEGLLQRWPGRVVFSVGSELSLFAQGFVPGTNVFERLSHPRFMETVRAGGHNPPLNAFLAKANAEVRELFHGKVTYASVSIETIDWGPFDFVGVDLYRDKQSRAIYRNQITRYMAHDKPVANMEVGCCTFRGADDLGGRGFEIVDWSSTPPKLTGDYVYDQATQAHEVADLLRVNDEAGIDSVFVFTFEDQAGLEDGNRDLIRQLPFDFDIARYGLVKMHVDRQRGTAYPDMLWEPKESFRAVADYYAEH
jgi:hypothetical protein